MYAKALALVGLGALAAAGAVVDYWPVSREIPRVAAVRGLAPAPPAVLRAANLAGPGSRLTPAARIGSQRRPQRGPVVSVPVTPEQNLEFPWTVHAIPAGEPVRFSVPGSTRPTLALAAAHHLAGLEMGIPVATEPVPAFDFLPEGLHGPGTERADGLVTGALKKTGESIVKTGAATGASIADAFRGVMGAFKKVSPFKDEAVAYRPAGAGL